MASSTTFVIIGGGLAGAKAVEALRVNDFDGQIILFADETQLPYERPPLSKEYLAGKKSLADFTVHDSADWYRRPRRRAAARLARCRVARTSTRTPSGSADGSRGALRQAAAGYRFQRRVGHRFLDADAAGVHYLTQRTTMRPR